MPCTLLPPLTTCVSNATVYPMSPHTRADGRTAEQLRSVSIHRSYQHHPDGSVLFAIGGTRVLCAANLENRVPPWLDGTGGGWATCEYNMLPSATSPRSAREGRKRPVSGRTMEIQRLIGRSIRSILDFEALGANTFTIDCDVLDADGGTRTAGITGAFIALREAVTKALADGRLETDPIIDQVAAISAGIVSDTVLVDLSYEEDSQAAFDCNFVFSGSGGVVEIQGTAEGRPIAQAQFEAVRKKAHSAVHTLFTLQNGA